MADDQAANLDDLEFVKSKLPHFAARAVRDGHNIAFLCIAIPGVNIHENPNAYPFLFDEAAYKRTVDEEGRFVAAYSPADDAALSAANNLAQMARKDVEERLNISPGTALVVPSLKTYYDTFQTWDTFYEDLKRSLHNLTSESLEKKQHISVPSFMLEK